jgi:protein-S-isoprenylcysteine O-methyltransferase Ste14
MFCVFYRGRVSWQIVNPWYGQATFLFGLISMMLIRAPHGRRSLRMKIAENRNDWLDNLLRVFTATALFVLPVISIITPLLEFADYSLHVLPFFLGVVCLAMGLWLFYRAHADLGTNWSVTLVLREQHQLVTRGVYQRIRHPMYAAFLLIGLAQAFLLPNWIASPLSLLAFLLMFVVRLGPEERMMLDKFGDAYAAYMKRTKRLIPGVW